MYFLWLVEQTLALLSAIAAILKKYPQVPIILDEAYAEMRLDGNQYQSLLEIAPELYPRILLIRSATKALSAAGQRMAVLVTPNTHLMTKLLAKNISLYGHAPRADQKVFASAMDNFDEKNRKDLANFYRPQLELTRNRLKGMGASMPDENYKVEGTFYILADLSDLLGLDIPTEVEAALGKSGKISSDEDIAYYLMFKGISVAPLSYFGTPPKEGFIRITCSGGDTEMSTLCDIMENILIETRKLKKVEIEQQMVEVISTLAYLSPTVGLALENNYPQLFSQDSQLNPKTASELQNFIKIAKQYLSEAKQSIETEKKDRLFSKYGNNLEKSTIKIQSFFRSTLVTEKFELLKQQTTAEWEHWVNENYYELPELKGVLLKFNLEQKNKYRPWIDYLHQCQRESVEPQPFTL